MSINIFGILSKSSTSNPFIPIRDPGAMPGSAFIQANMSIVGEARERNILNEFMHGNIPDFMRNFTAVNVSNETDKITYLVSPDYLSIGHNGDYVRMPMSPLIAQMIADRYDCTLPTTKMVWDIWGQSINKVAPLPWGPPYNAEMESSYRYGVHSQRIQAQLADKNPFALLSGHKKDVVLTNRLLPRNPKRRVAIFGWIQLNGQPIQGLNTSSHDDKYADYSHGIRLVANDVMVNGMPMRIQDVFLHPKFSALLSNEGPLKFLRY
jgi:hypothetical protein